MISRLGLRKPFSLVTLALVLLVMCSPGFASQVLQVGRDGRSLAIAHFPYRHLLLLDRLCVYQKDTQLECGNVTRSNPYGAILRLDSTQSGIQVGDDVRLAQLDEEGDSHNRGNRLFRTRSSHPSDQANSAFLLGVGVNYIYPQVKIHWKLADHYSIDLMPSYYEVHQEAFVGKCLGLVVGMSYYGGDNFDGFWAQIGYGSMSGNWQRDNDTTEGITRPTNYAFLGLGWRWQMDSGMNIGAALGLTTVDSGDLGGYKVRAQIPLISLDLAVPL